MAAMFLVEYGAEIGLSVLLDKMTEKRDQQKMKSLIEEFIVRKSKLNWNVSMDEEFDFEGLCQYLRTDLLTDVQSYIFANGENRESIEQGIKEKAKSFSQSTGRKSKERAINYVMDLMDILYSFYRSYRTDAGMLLLAGEIEEYFFKNLKETNKSIQVIQVQNAQEHQSLRDEIRNVADTIQDKDNRQIIQLKERISRYVSSYKDRMLMHPIFPWFPESKRLCDIFPKMFVVPTIKTSEKNVSFNELLEYRNQHIVILGDAGSGKSTMLRYLFAFSVIETVNCIYLTAKEANMKNNILDDIIRLASLSDDEHFLVFIDGIDEEFLYDYNGFLNFITKIQATVNVSFWFGCRPAFYNHNYYEGLSFICKKLFLEPWCDDQTSFFVREYSKITHNKSFVTSFQEIIKSSDNAAQFLSNPFQLSLLVFLADQNDVSPVQGAYNLYERFLYRWIEHEQKRGTTKYPPKTVLQSLQRAAICIYSSKKYILDEKVDSDTAVHDLLVIGEKEDLYHTQYAISFCHQSLAAFLLAEYLIESFRNNDTHHIYELLNLKLKNDVTDFAVQKMNLLEAEEKVVLQRNLANLYHVLSDHEIVVKEQIIYFITRLEIDVSSFLLGVIENPPAHPVMRLSLAYGCVLSENPIAREFALDYARSIAADSIDAITNRAWATVYFGDVNDRDPYTYSDDEKRPWTKARKARLKHFTKKSPKLSDYRFRIFDIPLFHSFLRDRSWNDLSLEEYDIFKDAEFPDEFFSKEEKIFIKGEQAKLVAEYKQHLESYSTHIH